MNRTLIDPTMKEVIRLPRPSEVLSRYQSRKVRQFYLNDFSVLNPTIWAQESLAVLQPNMVMANLIHRDFQEEEMTFGDIINTFLPGQFQMTRKGSLCENVTVQDASGASIQVALDQWPQVSFLICDGEERKGFLWLYNRLFRPAVEALAAGVDRIIGSQVYQFLENSGGHLMNVDETNIKQYLIETREVMNRNNVPLRGRTLVLTTGTESEALQVDAFTDASRVGDDGTALREAAIGRKYGFDILMTQTQPEVSNAQTLVTGPVDVNGAHTVADNTIIIDGAGAPNVVAGQWVRISGDDTPQQVVSNIIIAAGPTYTMTITPGLKRAIADNAVVTAIKSGAVNNAAGYIGTTSNPRRIGWAKEILVDGFANSPPQIGQMVTFGTSTRKYAIIKLRIIDIAAGTFGIELDKPLADPLVDNQTVNLGPAGKYNFAFQRNAFTLLWRMLAAPQAGTGAVSRTLTDPVNNIGIRVTITYDGNKQGHLVTLDFLVGVGVLSSDSGAVMLG